MKKKVNTEVKNTSKATIHDFDIIIEPIITEKTMAQSQMQNKFVFKVTKDANKTEIKNAVERVFNVHVKSVQTVNVMAKSLSRGSRYKGHVPSFKKAIVTLNEGETINLFQE